MVAVVARRLSYAALCAVFVAAGSASCSDSGPQEVHHGLFGLSEACSPVKDEMQLVAPGELVLGEKESVRKFEVDSDGSLEHSIFLALDGVSAGDSYPVESLDEADLSLIRIPEEGVNVDGPGRWPVVVVVPGRQGPGSVDLNAFRYENQQGESFEGRDQFRLEMVDSRCW